MFAILSCDPSWREAEDPKSFVRSTVYSCTSTTTNAIMNKDQQLALERHNSGECLRFFNIPPPTQIHLARAEVGLQPLIWSWQLAEHAQARADHLSQQSHATATRSSAEKALEGESVTTFSGASIQEPLNEATRLWQLEKSRWHGGHGAIRKNCEEGCLHNRYTQVRAYPFSYDLLLLNIEDDLGKHDPRRHGVGDETRCHACGGEVSSKG